MLSWVSPFNVRFLCVVGFAGGGTPGHLILGGGVFQKKSATTGDGPAHVRLPCTTIGHGSSEGHEMLKRNDKYHSTADDVPIPNM